jgi:hypothetical protein
MESAIRKVWFRVAARGECKREVWSRVAANEECNKGSVV